MPRYISLPWRQHRRPQPRLARCLQTGLAQEHTRLQPVYTCCSPYTLLCLTATVHLSQLPTTAVKTKVKFFSYIFFKKVDELTSRQVDELIAFFTVDE